jgi:hypothetical protein
VNARGKWCERIWKKVMGPMKRKDSVRERKQGRPVKGGDMKKGKMQEPEKKGGENERRDDDSFKGSVRRKERKGGRPQQE